MSECLGLYIEKNVIKYAKIAQEHGQNKIKKIGIKTCEDIAKGIDSIVEETQSSKTPISINIANAEYEYFDLFSLLSVKDLKGAIKTEFEAYCSEKKYNPETYLTQYVAVKNVENPEKIRIIHARCNKVDFEKAMQNFKKEQVQFATPIAVNINNILKKKEDCIILNLENEVEATLILEGMPYSITKIEQEGKPILEEMQQKIGSYEMAYKICKETTIYTSEVQEISENEIANLEIIMPVLYKIVGSMQKIINISPKKIHQIYLTGTLANIKNIDKYFQEYLEDVRCEILNPSEIVQDASYNEASAISYVDVNSAISLALLGLGQGLTKMNFKIDILQENISNLFEIKKNESKKQNKINSIKTENALKRICVILVIIIFMYTIFQNIVRKKIDKKNNEAEIAMNNLNEQITMASSNTKKLKQKTLDYSGVLSGGQEESTEKTYKSIPTLLEEIMKIVPKEVQITLIENTEKQHIKIGVQSKKYEQLSYFISKIKNQKILENTISDTGTVENEIIKITIEGDLP